MTTDEREERELRAAEYALGTLAGPERERFERALAEDSELRGLVEDWNRRLGPLAEAVPPVAPPPEVWARIEAATGAAPETRVPTAPALLLRLRRWRVAALASGALAAALALYIALTPPAERPGYMALLNDAQARPAVAVTIDATRQRITVRPVGALAPGDKALELWLLPKEGKPRSLGVFPHDQRLARTLPAPLAAALPEVTALAVSLEPPGGSPTGLPTGPVLYSGPLVALAR